MEAFHRIGFCLLIIFGSAGIAHAESKPFVLPDTRVLDFTSKDGAHPFRLLIGLPRDYEKRTNERFQTIYLLDADYAFPLAQEMLRHATDRGQLKEAIIVGLAYPGADSDLGVYFQTRTRDYTPLYDPAEQKDSGGADAFLNLLRTEILPYIDANFRTQPNDRMIVGHSFGGLLATYAMLSAPGLFQHFLVVSPSLWYGNSMMFTLAANYAEKHKQLPANVFYAIGSFENRPGLTMVDDMKAFDGQLTRAHLEGYHSS
ncbi:MAG: alpha/beta hydrolase, partial [Rhizomicrobium sp.]